MLCSYHAGIIRGENKLATGKRKLSHVKGRSCRLPSQANRKLTSIRKRLYIRLLYLIKKIPPSDGCRKCTSAFCKLRVYWKFHFDSIYFLYCYLVRGGVNHDKLVFDGRLKTDVAIYHSHSFRQGTGRLFIGTCRHKNRNKCPRAFTAIKTHSYYASFRPL